MLQPGDRQPECRIVTQFKHLRQQRRIKLITLMIDIGIGKEQIFGDLAQFGVAKATNFRLFLLRRLIKVGSMEQGLRQIFCQLPCRQGVIVALDQFAAPDVMIRKIFLHHHRQFGIVMEYLYRMPWAKTAVNQQGFRFNARPIKR
ncbi:hypothetical protein D3C80_1737840 [compost metagenome]